MAGLAEFRMPAHIYLWVASPFHPTPLCSPTPLKEDDGSKRSCKGFGGFWLHHRGRRITPQANKERRLRLEPQCLPHSPTNIPTLNTSRIVKNGGGGLYYIVLKRLEGALSQARDQGRGKSCSVSAALTLTHESLVSVGMCVPNLSRFFVC